MRTEYLPGGGLLSGVRSGLTRGIARWSAAVLLAGGVAAAPTPAAAAAADANLPANTPTIMVTGSSLANVVVSPLTLIPAFDPTITDYVLRCQAGINTVHVSLVADGGTISAQGNHGATLDIRQDLIENQALVVGARAPHPFVKAQSDQAGEVGSGGRVQYWIRCLPHDFPQLSVSRPGNPPPGWYLTSNLNSVSGSGFYSMVLDNHGTPVWYQRQVGGRAIDVTPLPDGTIAWWSGPADSVAGGVFDDYNLGTQATRVFSSPDLPVDLHELDPLQNGDVMILTSPPKPNVDLTPLGLSSNATIADCVIEQLNAKGEVVWSWRASDHISPREGLHPEFGGDIYHCNSVDVDPVSGNVLLSSRHTDAVYLIDKKTGRIVWKMGGNSPNYDQARILSVKDDPEGVFHAQHDARFQPNGDVSLFDDQSWNSSLAARGVEYHIDPSAGTATFVWSYQSPDGRNSPATGSFRRLDAGSDNIIGWGTRPGGPQFTEVNGLGRILLSATFPNGEVNYRVIKVPVDALDHGLLRASAGLPTFVPTVSPTVAFVGPTRGPARTDTGITITGTGLTGATAVSFGLKPAAAFTVNNDSSITAVPPIGSGAVAVTVATPRGITTPGSALTATDSDFEGDIGSWRSDSVIVSSTAYALSGAYSLQLSRPSAGSESVASGRYAVPPGTLVTGGERVLTPGRSDRVRATILFYDSHGVFLAMGEAPLVTTSGDIWTLVSETTRSPVGTASAALAFEDLTGIAPVYLDSAFLIGSDQYVYGPPDAANLAR